jgi:hypothetical protein
MVSPLIVARHQGVGRSSWSITWWVVRAVEVLTPARSVAGGEIRQRAAEALVLEG